jgi:hypothetical protein
MNSKRDPGCALMRQRRIEKESYEDGRDQACAPMKREKTAVNTIQLMSVHFLFLMVMAQR